MRETSKELNKESTLQVFQMQVAYSISSINAGISGAHTLRIESDRSRHVVTPLLGVTAFPGSPDCYRPGASAHRSGRLKPMDLAINADDVRRAAERIRPLAQKTPVFTSAGFDTEAGSRVFFKCENLQRGGTPDRSTRSRRSGR